METKKILVRNIPINHWEALETLAAKHDRSLEAEARQAFSAWVQPVLISKEKCTRTQDLSKRLQHLLEQANAERQGPPLRPSNIAQIIGEQSAGPTEKWFLGEEEPSFAQLIAIGRELGASNSWLLHGIGSAYPVVYESPPKYSDEVAKWLCLWEENTLEDPKTATEIHFVEEENKPGRLVIVRLSEKRHPRICILPFNESEAAKNQSIPFTYFADALTLLPKYSTDGSKVIITGRLLKTAEFLALTNGNTHPDNLLKNSTKLLWWKEPGVSA